MRNIAIIISSIFLLSMTAIAGENKGPNKKEENTHIYLAEKISNMLGYPSDILEGASEVVMISYSVDENNIIHVSEILSPNIALKAYVLEHMDGNKMKKHAHRRKKRSCESTFQW